MHQVDDLERRGEIDRRAARVSLLGNPRIEWLAGARGYSFTAPVIPET
jgi:hypothetical protein